MNSQEITAIVPAYNEEENIGNVLKVLLNSVEIKEVIVVDGASSDRTAEISKNFGARVIKMPKRTGKAEAMAVGVEAASAEIIAFFDADLIGLKPVHISLLVKPILEKKAEMTIGIRERGSWKGKVAKFFIKIDPLLAIGGERVMRKGLFESLPSEFIKGFAIETVLNYYCLKKKLKVVYVDLKGVDIVVKEKKWGIWKGFLNRLKMIFEILKIRIILSKKKFNNEINS